MDIPRKWRVNTGWVIQQIHNSCLIWGVFKPNNDWLVVSNMSYSPIHIWDVILPIDFHSVIFQDGHIAPPTRWLMIDDNKNEENRNPWTGNSFEPVWRDDVGGFWRRWFRLGIYWTPEEIMFSPWSLWQVSSESTGGVPWKLRFCVFFFPILDMLKKLLEFK